MRPDRKLLKQKSWIYRYPRLFGLGGSIIITGFILAGPIYSIASSEDDPTSTRIEW